jgi:hypothetical protein
MRQTSVHEPRSSCDGNQFEETRSPRAPTFLEYRFHVGKFPPVGENTCR